LAVLKSRSNALSVEVNLGTITRVVPIHQDNAGLDDEILSGFSVASYPLDDVSAQEYN
jgi:hypothetical protein